MAQGLYGALVFTVSDSEVATFRDLSISREATYVEHKNLAGKPKLQFVGHELETVTLTVQLVPVEGASAVNARLLALQAMTLAGEPLPLLIGLNYYGLYVLPSYKITHRIIHFGVSLSATVELSLQEYN